MLSLASFSFLFYLIYKKWLIRITI
jgi:hypothetical protein